MNSLSSKLLSAPCIENSNSCDHVSVCSCSIVKKWCNCISAWAPWFSLPACTSILTSLSQSHMSQIVCKLVQLHVRTSATGTDVAMDWEKSYLLAGSCWWSQAVCGSSADFLWRSSRLGRGQGQWGSSERGFEDCTASVERSWASGKLHQSSWWLF